MNEIEAVLNRLQYEHKTGRDAVISWVNSELAKAQKAVEDELQRRFGASEIGSKVLGYINGNNPNGQKYIDEVFAEVRNRVDKAIPVDSPAEQAIEEVLAELNDIKMTMINKATSCVEDVLEQVSDLANDTVKSMQDDLDKIISDNADKISDKATKDIQKKISDATNNFMENTLSKVDTTVDGGSGPKSLASIIKFGYKEYMMLFVYIALCVDSAQDNPENNKILLRTADLIQLNINHAGTGSSFKHNKGANFRMKDACTYISINAEADLDMFFMKFDLFSSVVEDQNGDDSQVTVETDSTGTKIRYKGILGY